MADFDIEFHLLGYLNCTELSQTENMHIFLYNTCSKLNFVISYLKFNLLYFTISKSKIAEKIF